MEIKKEYVVLMMTLIIIVPISGYFGQSTIDAHVKDITNRTDENEIRFITVGDPHVKTINDGNRGNERLALIVDFVNKLDVDFVVFMGDMADNGTKESSDIVKRILSNMNKPYFVVAGNHDIKESPKIFESYYGPMEHIEMINGYQLIFVGITEEKAENGDIKLNWSFDFSKAKKDLPTLVFAHGPPQKPPPDCISCRWGKDILGYAQTMRPELDKFTNLIGVYAGHVHYTSYQTFNGTIYTTINGLITIKLAELIPVLYPSDDIGYSVIKDGKLNYSLISYKG